MFWKMSSFRWDVGLINQSFNKRPAWKKVARKWRMSTWNHMGVRLVKRKIIYVGDWSVRSHPIICWDVNYTVASVHVRRQIIEEGKRRGAFYLCSRSQQLRASVFAASPSAVFLWPVRMLAALLRQSWSFCKFLVFTAQWCQQLCIDVHVCVCSAPAWL